MKKTLPKSLINGEDNFEPDRFVDPCENCIHRLNPDKCRRCKHRKTLFPPYPFPKPHPFPYPPWHVWNSNNWKEE